MLPLEHSERAYFSPGRAPPWLGLLYAAASAAPRIESAGHGEPGLSFMSPSLPGAPHFGEILCVAHGANFEAKAKKKSRTGFRSGRVVVVAGERSTPSKFAGAGKHDAQRWSDP